MSGVGEASAIFGLITGSIDAIKLAIEIYKAADGNAPARIQKVADQLPSIQELLENARDTKDEHDGIWRTVAKEVDACGRACQALEHIFDKAFPKEGAGKVRRVWNATGVIFTGKRSEAEGHMAVIHKTLAVLKGKLIITNTRLLEELKTAVDELNDDEGGIYHYGPGDNVVNKSTGTFNYTKGDNNKIIDHVGTYHEAAPTKPTNPAA
jgi:hypothetical protein